MKTILIVIGIIVLVGAVAAGSFWGGMTYQSNQGDQARQRFMSERGITEGDFPAGGAPGGRQFPGGGAGFPGGGTMGTIKTIDGNTMTLSTAQDVVTVLLTDSTRVQKTEITGVEELETGLRVMVSGEQDKNGEITANQVMVLDNNAPVQGEPYPTP